MTTPSQRSSKHTQDAHLRAQLWVIADAPSHVIGMEFSLLEQRDQVMIVQSVLDLVVFATSELDKPAITQEP